MSYTRDEILQISKIITLHLNKKKSNVHIPLTYCTDANISHILFPNLHPLELGCNLQSEYFYGKIINLYHGRLWNVDYDFWQRINANI
jgi:hypothetical protein